MKSQKISKNLEELLIFLIQDQLNDESSQIIKEILTNQNIENNTKFKTKSLLIKNLEKQNKNISQLNIENIMEKLNNLDFIDYNETKEGITIKTENILNILLYPRYCYYISNKYGPNNLKIFEYLLEFGNYNENLNKFQKNDFNSLIRDGIIIKTKIPNKNNSEIFNTNKIEIYKINYKLMNELIFKEYLINYYRKYISMNFKFYDLFKKVINSNNYVYQLKDYEKNIQISQMFVDNLDYSNLLVKNEKNNNIELNKEIIKFDLFYYSIEKIINLFFSSKHTRLLRIIQLNPNLNLFQISQKACLKYLEVQEILDDLINKLKVVKKIQNENDKDNFVYLLNDINETIIDNRKNNIYGIIKNIKFELKDKLKELQGRIDQNMVLQYINKYYALINIFSEILNSYNFLFN